jgi:hypothetical protein
MLGLLVVGSLMTLLFPAPAEASNAEQTAEGTAYLNPFFTPSPSECPPTQGFGAGDLVVLTSGVLIRVAPDQNSPFLQQFQENREFFVVGGPVCNFGYNWYNITGHGLTGWVSEGNVSGTRLWLVLVRSAGQPAIACAAPLILTPGSRFEINVNVRMRAEPSIDATTVTVIPFDASVVVLEGPRCVDGYNWWKVRATVVNFTYEGWAAEASRGGTEFINQPRSAPCHAPLALTIGGLARVIYTDESPKRLRDAPSVNGVVLTRLIENVPLEILGGPVCADSYNWWPVRVLSSTPIDGWLAEGGPSNWWIAPLSDFR